MAAPVAVDDLYATPKNAVLTVGTPPAAPPATIVLGLWTTAAELASLPTSGAAWTNLANTATGGWGTPNAGNQDDNTNIQVMAGALYYARTGDTAMRTKVRNALMAVIGTHTPSTGGEELAISREMGAYVVSADLINLENYSSSDNTAFKNWLTVARTFVYSTGRSMVTTNRQRPNNFGTVAGFSRAVSALYLGLTSDYIECKNIFRSWLDGPAVGGWTFTDWDSNQSWQAVPGTPSTWRGIVQAGTMRDGHDFDGIMPEEQRRNTTTNASNYTTWQSLNPGTFPPPWAGNDYRFESLQGALAQAVVHYRQGYDVWNWGDQGIKRAFLWLKNVNNLQATGDDRWEPYLVNYFYGTDTLPLPSGFQAGKGVGFTEWTHATPGADADFIYRSTLPGTKRVFNFNEYDVVAGHNQANDHGYFFINTHPHYGTWPNSLGTPGPYSHGSYNGVNWRLDTGVKASGRSSLNITFPNFNGTDAGYFRANFTDQFTNAIERAKFSYGEGDEFWVQFRWRCDDNTLKKWLDGGGGAVDPKIAIIGQGDIINGPPFTQGDDITGGTSCTPLEIVPSIDQSINHGNNRFGGPLAYHSCGAAPRGGFDGFTQWEGGSNEVGPPGGIIRLQNARAGCDHPAGTSAQCVRFQAGEWATIKMHVIIGKWGTASSRIQMYLAHEGQPDILIGDTFFPNPSGYPLATPTPGYKYGKVHLIPYVSNHSSSEDRGGPSNHWWDELIVSDHDIPTPGLANRTALAEASRLLLPGKEVIFNQEGAGTEAGFNRTLLRGQTGDTDDNIFEYSNYGAWDPSSRKVLFCGQSDPTPQAFGKFIEYSEDSNLWSLKRQGNELDASPLWYSSNFNFKRHAYQHSTIHPARGDFFHRIFGSSTVAKWTQSNNGYNIAFSTIPGGNKNQATFLTWFPERDRLVYADDFVGLYEFNPVTSTWTNIHPASTFTNKIGTHGLGIYCKARKSIIIGCGNGNTVLQEYKADGTIVSFPSPPVILGTGGGSGTGQGIMIPDPISGRLLIFANEAQLWEMNEAGTSWVRRNGGDGRKNLEPNISWWNYGIGGGWRTFSKIVVPIPKYGVLMFCVFQLPANGGSRVYLYKHTIF